VGLQESVTVQEEHCQFWLPQYMISQAITFMKLRFKVVDDVYHFHSLRCIVSVDANACRRMPMDAKSETLYLGPNHQRHDRADGKLHQVDYIY
jgi:hypothetical protein